jgi:fibrillarin-like rRNA methylase
MQDQDFEYFIQNMESFYKQYGHKFLSIKDRNILGAYDSFDMALEETLKREPIGTFIIQECFKSKEESVNHFQGNVALVPAG